MEGKVAKLKRNRIKLCVIPNHRVLFGGKLVDEDSRPRSFFGEGVLDGLAELRLPRLDLDYLDFHLRFLSFPARAYPPLLLTV